HYVWTIQHGGTTVYYYVNAEREARSSMPLLIKGEHEAAIPHLLLVNDIILVLFWNGNGRVEYVYSFNRGERWSASSYIHVGTYSSLRLVQSVRHQSCAISPEPVLGLHWPFFRPLGYMDLLNPPIVPELSKSIMERLRWMKLQMDCLYSDYLRLKNQLTQETNELSRLKEASEDQVRHLMQEVDQLKQEEHNVLDQLKAWNPMAEEEPFSLRFIR
ncbi:hypothetical protein V7139_32025, partial [Neobacillus drentensis]|uniref:hypothetical protein n=1 Tax=Neobacillus drentensis TaxID=220684 RepID=UPI003003939A